MANTRKYSKILGLLLTLSFLPGSMHRSSVSCKVEWKRSR